MSAEIELNLLFQAIYCLSNVLRNICEAQAKQPDRSGQQNIKTTIKSFFRIFTFYTFSHRIFAHSNSHFSDSISHFRTSHFIRLLRRGSLPFELMRICEMCRHFDIACSCSLAMILEVDWPHQITACAMSVCTTLVITYRKFPDRSPRLLSVQFALTPGLYPGPGVYPRPGLYRNM